MKNIAEIQYQGLGRWCLFVHNLIFEGNRQPDQCGSQRMGDYCLKQFPAVALLKSQTEHFRIADQVQWSFPDRIAPPDCNLPYL